MINHKRFTNLDPNVDNLMIQNIFTSRATHSQ